MSAHDGDGDELNDLIARLLEEERRALDADRYTGPLSWFVRTFSAIAGLDPREMSEGERKKLPILGLQLLLSAGLALFGFARFASLAGATTTGAIIFSLLPAALVFCLDRSLLGRGYRATDDVRDAEIVAWMPAVLDEERADPVARRAHEQAERAREEETARAILEPGALPSNRFYAFRFALGLALGLLFAIGVDTALFGDDARSHYLGEKTAKIEQRVEALDDKVEAVEKARGLKAEQLVDSKAAAQKQRDSEQRGQHGECRPGTRCFKHTQEIGTMASSISRLRLPLEEDASDKDHKLPGALSDARAQLAFLQFAQPLPKGVPSPVEEGGLGTHLTHLFGYMFANPGTLVVWLLVTIALCVLDLSTVLHKYVVRRGTYEKKTAQRDRLAFLLASRRRWLTARAGASADAFASRERRRAIERADDDRQTEHARRLMAGHFFRADAASKVESGDEDLQATASGANASYLEQLVDAEIERLHAERLAGERADTERAQLRAERAKAEAEAARAERIATEEWARHRAAARAERLADEEAARAADERAERDEPSPPTDEQPQPHDPPQPQDEPIDPPGPVYPGAGPPPSGPPTRDLERHYVGAQQTRWTLGRTLNAAGDDLTRVVAATSPDLGPAALKFGIVPPTGHHQTGGRDEVENEIYILRNHNHRGMPPLMDWAAGGETPWFATPQYELSLAEWLGAGEALELEQLLGIVVQLLDQWQRWGEMVDPDRKPGNIMLAGDRTELNGAAVWRVVQIDFGQAHRHGSFDSMLRKQRGTPVYTHPSVLRQEDGDRMAVPGPHSMFWSACLILWEGIAGALPGAEYGDGARAEHVWMRINGLANGSSAMSLASVAPEQTPPDLIDFVDGHLKRMLSETDPGSLKTQQAELAGATKQLEKIFERVAREAAQRGSSIYVGSPEAVEAKYAMVGRPVGFGPPPGTGAQQSQVYGQDDAQGATATLWADQKRRSPRPPGAADPATGQPNFRVRIPLSDDGVKKRRHWWSLRRGR